MFSKFIRLINDGKAYSQYELSQELKLSLETVQAFIEYLSVNNILLRVERQPEESSCSNNCNRCAGCKKNIKNQPLGHTPILWAFQKNFTGNSMRKTWEA